MNANLSIKQAARWQLLIASALVAAVYLFLAILIIPKFQRIFADMGWNEVPRITLLCLSQAFVAGCGVAYLAASVLILWLQPSQGTRKTFWALYWSAVLGIAITLSALLEPVFFQLHP